MTDSDKKLKVRPGMAVPGGVVELVLSSEGFIDYSTVRCSIGGVAARVMSASRRGLHVQVPEDVEGSVEVEVSMPVMEIAEFTTIQIGREYARDLHIVANPVVDPIDGSIVTTRSGGRGQVMPVSLFRITKSGGVVEIDAELMNPTGLAFDSNGDLFISARADGEVWRLDRAGRLSAFSTGLGVPTGMAFGVDGALYVGDRTGTIFRLSTNGDPEVFAKLDASVAAFHLAFSPDGELYVTSPSLSGYDSIQIVDSLGFVRTFFRGLGRPQGIAFDSKGSVFVVASYRGRRGVLRISIDSGDVEMVVSGPDIVGIAFRGDDELIVATRERVYGLDV